jgi:uncharacterized protein (DUF2235 family)
MKRILIFFDGTWNRPDVRDEISNVVNLHSAALAKDVAGHDQIAHYEIGIATEKNLERWSFAAGAIGVGVAERIISGYKMICRLYQPGDEIQIYGFSRGAFQARSLGGLVTLLGVLKPDVTATVEDAWACYRQWTQAPDEKRIAVIRTQSHYPARIKLIGVWDTVGNLGLPFMPRRLDRRELEFRDTQLSPLVDVGLHALSIDEPRGPFRPTLWTRKWNEKLPEGQRIEQVWFPGCHANVGGGYPDHRLSDISLLWMAERAMATTGVAFDMAKLRREAMPDPLGAEVRPTAERAFRVTDYMPYIRLIDQDLKGISPWRRAVFGGWRSNRLPADLEPVNESLHASAIARFGQRVVIQHGKTLGSVIYRPRTLKLALRRMNRKTS